MPDSIDAVAVASLAWAALGPNARRTRLLKAADAIAAKAGEFTALMTAETGAAAPWGGFNAHLAANVMREAASMTTQVAGEVIPSDKPGCVSLAISRPAGVCVGTAPWNAPVILGVRAVAMPLACGNTVVLNASELCLATHRLIGTALAEAADNFRTAEPRCYLSLSGIGSAADPLARVM